MTAHGFQARAVAWVKLAFGTGPQECRAERAHRFLEEALEVVQAAGCTREEAQQLVDYVYSRPAGELRQEIGGAALTLAILAAAHDLDIEGAAEAELGRVSTPEVLAKCRAKNALKSPDSPLPGKVP